MRASTYIPEQSVLEDRIRRLLPDLYLTSEQTIKPATMSSAPLRFSPDGQVAWDQMWASFCDLAMAGGPPHKGTLLTPATPAEFAAQPGRYQQVTAELCRGITLVTGLEAAPSSTPGWVRVECLDPGMSAWLLRAITMENIAVRVQAATLYLPSGPAYRLEKEVKNVITVIAKTCHYWRDHTLPPRRHEIFQLLADMDQQSPCLVPLYNKVGSSQAACEGWRGVEVESVAQAVAMMRLLVAANVLARRENKSLYLPLNPIADPGETRVTAALEHVQRITAAG